MDNGMALVRTDLTREEIRKLKVKALNNKTTLKAMASEAIRDRFLTGCKDGGKRNGHTKR